ncbi:uncharacterized protein TNCV_311981 [Trichonephila clavipes]|nr:uncharacterized protein TNCV_311981 [Trichonephila clavipes]
MRFSNLENSSLSLFFIIKTQAESLPKTNEIGSLIEEVVDLARQINSEVDSDYVQELLDSYKQGLIIVELKEVNENSLENVDSPLNQVEKRTKLASLSEVKAKIDKLRTESYRVLSDEELMDFESSLDTMEVDADNLEVSLNTLLESSNVNTSELSVKNDFANYNVKLPSINLPEFSGQYIDWLQFKSQFVSLIHDNTCLSDSQKLYYLQSALKGHAKQLQTVNDSYSSLFEALEGRYENKRLIVNSHIAELLNPNKIKFESAFHLRSLIDSIQSHLRALKQLELEPNALYESMLIFVITQRLDDESCKQYEMELHSNNLPKWNNFLDLLIKRSQALENVQRNSSLKNKNEYSPKFRSFVVESN